MFVLYKHFTIVAVINSVSSGGHQQNCRPFSFTSFLHKVCDFFLLFSIFFFAVWINKVKWFSEPCSPDSPRSLKHLCRLQIRRRLTLKRLNNPEIMNSHVIPPRLKSFILYQELDLYSQDPERIMWTVMFVFKDCNYFLIFVIFGFEKHKTVIILF